MDIMALLEMLITAWTPFFCLVAYIMFLLYARRIWICRRNIAHLYAYTDMVKIQLAAEQHEPDIIDPVEQAVIPKIEHLLSAARTTIQNEQSVKGWRSFLSPEDISQQLAAWRLIHDADRLATDLWRNEHVEAKAIVVKESLKELDTAPAKELSEAIATTLKNKTPDKLRPLVKEARGMLFNARDNYFEELSDWQNKALWLVLVASIIIILIAAVPQLSYSIYMLLGAIGGLLARLRKTLTARKSSGFDYGVSWSMLFLAPLIGALTGWTGILLSQFVVELKVFNIPDTILQSELLMSNAKLALAVVFGYSATFFEKVMSGAEATLTKKPVGDDSKDK